MKLEEFLEQTSDIPDDAEICIWDASRSAFVPIARVTERADGAVLLHLPIRPLGDASDLETD